MNQLKIILIVAALFIAPYGNAEIRSIQEVISKATATEKQNIGMLLEQIRMIPSRKASDGSQLFKVVHVEKNSLWEREGIQPGDLMASENSFSPGQAIQLTNKPKTKTNSESTKK